MNWNGWIGKVLLGLGILVPVLGFAISAYIGSTGNSPTIFSSDSLQTEGEVVLTLEDFPEPAETGNQPGDRVPDFALLLDDGSTVTSSSLVEAGQPTYLFFWATY